MPLLSRKPTNIKNDIHRNYTYNEVEAELSYDLQNSLFISRFYINNKNSLRINDIQEDLNVNAPIINKYKIIILKLK